MARSDVVMPTVLRGMHGLVRGFIDTTGTVHAMQRGGWSVCGRRRRKSWRENVGGFVAGGGPECDRCESRLGTTDGE